MSEILTVTLNPSVDKTIEIEGFEYGGLNRVAGSRTDPGGKGINVSKVLSNFNTSNTASGLIAGKQGKYITDTLKSVNIDNCFLEVFGETRTNIKLYDISKKITTEINEKGFTADDSSVKSFITLFESLLDNTEIVAISGSVPLGINNDIYANLTSIAKSKGVKVILDADGKRLENGIEAIPYAIKPNLYELERLTGSKMNTLQDIINAMKSIIAKGIEMVTVSLGKYGAVFMDKSNVYRSHPFYIECKSTVGAGDSMVAAIAYCLLNNYSLYDTARFATCAGTITASKEGTLVCTLDEVRSNMSRVKIDEIKEIII